MQPRCDLKTKSRLSPVGFFIDGIVINSSRYRHFRAIYLNPVLMKRGH